MPEETKHGMPTPPGMECSEFEALLSSVIDGDALDGDGGLSAARKESFETHRRGCAVCGPLFADVRAGREWLRALELEPVEPPAHLVHNILAATSGVGSTRLQTVRGDGRTTPVGERLRERWDSFFAPVAAFVRQPRFVMSFGMIFFVFSLILSTAGFKAADVAKISLRPSALRHAYNDAQIKVVKYYDNIRFVYEIESKVRELRRTNPPAEPSPAEQKENRKNNTSGQPDQRQDRNYSQEYNQPVLAGLRNASPAVRVTTNRRLV
jgi:hypothetical protein